MPQDCQRIATNLNNVALVDGQLVDPQRAKIRVDPHDNFSIFVLHCEINFRTEMVR